jgi:hypothetical protein
VGAAVSIWAGILGKLPQAAAAYFTRRAELKAEALKQERAIKDAMHQRQIELIKAGLAADCTWEMESLRAHASGWKDEAAFLVVSIPAVMCFIPGCDKYVKAGFQALSVTPWWYSTMFLSIYLATFGIRWWRRQQSDT